MAPAIGAFADAIEGGADKTDGDGLLVWHVYLKR
jgi:hypothetical protein